MIISSDKRNYWILEEKNIEILIDTLCECRKRLTKSLLDTLHWRKHPKHVPEGRIFLIKMRLKKGTIMDRDIYLENKSSSLKILKHAGSTIKKEISCAEQHKNGVSVWIESASVNMANESVKRGLNKNA